MEQTQGVPAGASSAESPCQFAIDGGGNLYRRYSEPVCASCVPVMKLTDKWESARVADFNAGWNACRNAMLSAAPQAQPVAEVQAKRADWMKPAAYRDRFADAVARLCCGRRAPDDMIDGWLTPGCEDNRLQHFAADNGPAWAQGIVLLDAADLLAETPTEGVEHGARPTAQSPAQAQPVDELLTADRLPNAGDDDAAYALLAILERCGDGATVGDVLTLIDACKTVKPVDLMADCQSPATAQAQPAAGVQAKGMVEQASNCKKPFFAHDPENGTEWFATEADAIAYARASLAYYQDWAQSDGEWSGDVEHVKIGRVTHIASESGNEEDGYNYSIRPLAAEATPSPAPAQAQPVEAEQAPAPVPELPPIDPGWTFNHARPKAGESGVWEIGFYDDEDDLFSPIVTVDTGLEYCKEGAEPLANAILARLAAQAPTVAPTQPSQPVREPMSWDLFVAACEAEYGEEFCPNNLGDVSDEEKAELMRVVSIVERHHGIGSKGGAESDVLGQGSQS